LPLLRAPLLFDDDDLGLDQRWRILATLFTQTRALTVGSLVQTATLLTACWQSGDQVLLVLAVVSPLALGARLHLARRFNATAPEMPAGTPEQWARRFQAGALLVAAIWGAADLVALLGVADPRVPLFVQMVQAGWVAGSAARNAASPRIVRGQTLLAILPCIAGVLLRGDTMLMAAIPFLLVQVIATETISNYGAEQIAALLRSERKLEVANAMLVKLSATDPLTGIGNRRAFDSALTMEWGRAAREGTQLALLAIDVDHFKAFNDHYGHPEGDACLRLVAEILSAGLRRPPDFAARVGGEEFSAILPGTDLLGAIDVADRLRRAIEDAAQPHAAAPRGRVTISIGVHSAAPVPGSEPHTMVGLADQALYAAKQAGRNQVRTAEGLTITQA